MSVNWKSVGEGFSGAFIILGAILTPFLRKQRLQWGATDAEQERSLPGDDLISRPKWQYTNAVTIDAPVAAVWPWLVQIGQGRGGWYSYQGLENLVGCKIRNADCIIPEFQDLKVGDGVRLADGLPGYPVAIVEPESAIVLHADSRIGPTPVPSSTKPGDFSASTWLFYIEPDDENRTRFITRLRNDYNPRFLQKLMFSPGLQEPVVTAMQRKMLKEIKRLAEDAAETN